MKLGKCKQALADLINSNGGWVDGEAIFAAMDGNGDLFGYSGRPQWTVSHGHWYGHTLTCWFFSPIVINNHHQTILSREEYYQAYPMTDDDGWIEWNGGECPVEKGLMVDIRVRDGREERNLAANTPTKGRIPDASCAFWKNDGMAGDIIAYRLHKPEVKPEFCESVTHGIPEPESIDGLCAKVTEENKHQHVDAKPTIEQLAADYRNAKDYADRKQQEADAAKADADSKLKALELAGEALGLRVSPITAKQEPELATVQVGDEVECVESNIKRDKYNGMVGRLHFIDESDTSTPYLVDFGGKERIWCHKVKFIRQP